MDILDLMKGAPGLLDAIKDVGVAEEQMPALGSALGKQLGGDDGFDFTDLLGGLDLDNFLAKIDVNQLAEQVGISPQIAQQVVNLIGPQVADFTPGKSGLLGSLVGRFLK